jgi:hypothetical protein
MDVQIGLLLKLSTVAPVFLIWTSIACAATITGYVVSGHDGAELSHDHKGSTGASASEAGRIASNGVKRHAVGASV